MISVVVPVYNKANELPRCLDSIHRQSEGDFECILIDDGSTDGSSLLCDNYCEKDSRFRVLHKDNGGLSAARNDGIRFSKGAYITLIDADDYVDEHYLRDLLYAVDLYKADIACMPLSIEKSTLVKASKSVYPPRAEEIKGRDALSELLYGRRISISACARLYRADILSDVLFPVGKLYEDV